MKKSIVLLSFSFVLLSACQPKQDNQMESQEPTAMVQVEQTELDTMAGYQMFALPYEYDALEPYIDAQTIALHYEKHTKGYFNKFLAAVRGTEWQGMPLEEIFAQADKVPESIMKNAGQLYNHEVYFFNMTQDSMLGEQVPSESLMSAIDEAFGSMDALKSQFMDKAKAVFGSGWVFLAKDGDGKLFIASTPNHINPLMNIVEKQGKPILACDVWEHSYYLKYQNKRADYLESFWSVINWQDVSERFAN